MRARSTTTRPLISLVPVPLSKTTLLNILSGRHSSSTSRLSAGSILLNGHAISYGHLSRASAFVQQSDVLLPSLTVRELIRFAALLKLPSDLPLSAKEARVDQVITELCLDKCKHTCVGASGAGEQDAGASNGGGGGGGNSKEDAANGGGNANTGGGVARSGISGGEQRRVRFVILLIAENVCKSLRRSHLLMFAHLQHRNGAGDRSSAAILG